MAHFIHFKLAEYLSLYIIVTIFWIVREGVEVIK